MTEVCREFGISRKTGYKIFDRYKEHGLEALSDRSRRPVRYANQLPAQIETLIVQLKTEKPHWGRARSASSWLGGSMAMSECRPKAQFMRCSIATTVKRGGSPRHRAHGTPLSQGVAPNDLWCTDFKGEFSSAMAVTAFP
jgi:hypothetical protein